MNVLSNAQEDAILYCQRHTKSRAEAICTQEDCNERLMCKKCIFEIHPEHHDYILSMNEIFSCDPSKQTQWNTQKKQFTDELSNGREQILQMYNQTIINVDNLDILTKKVPLNPSRSSELDSLKSIQNHFNRSGTQKDGRIVMTDNQELSNSLYQYSNRLEETLIGTNNTQKYRQLQSNLNRVYQDLSKKFEELYKELKSACPPKIINADIQADNSNINEKNAENSQGIAGNFQNQGTFARFEGLTASKNQDNSNIQVQITPRNELKGHQNQGHIGSAITSNGFDSVDGADTVISSVNSFKNFTIEKENTETSSSPALNRDNPQYTDVKVVSSINTSDIKEKESKIPKEILVGINLFGGDTDYHHSKTTLEEIEAFFDEEEDRKETLAVFEKWFHYAEQNSQIVSRELFGLLNRQKAIISAYKKITRKSADINCINSAIDEFFDNVRSKREEQNITILEDELQGIEKTLIKKYRSNVDESYFRATLDFMTKSRVAFGFEIAELKERLHKFRLSWIEKQSRLNRIFAENIPLHEYESMIFELWSFQIKLPEMENLLTNYFECKRAQAHLRYFLFRFEQSEYLRTKFFEEGRGTSDGNDSLQVKKLEEISLEKGILIQKKCLSLCKGIDFGDYYNQMIELIDKTVQLQKTITKVLATSSLDRNRNQELMNDCSRALFFPDMLKIKQLNRIFSPSKLIQAPSNSHEEETSIGNILEKNSLLRKETILPETPEAANKMTIEEDPSINSVENISPAATTQILPTQTPELYIRWVVSMANLVASVCQDANNHTKSSEIKQALEASKNSSISSSLCSLCMSCTAEFLKYEKDYREPLKKIVSESLNLKYFCSEEISKLKNYTAALIWGIKANAIFQSVDPSIEQLKDCHGEFLQCRFECCEDSQILSFHFKLIGFIKLFADYQQIENIDWCKLAEEKNYESIINRLKEIEQTYQYLGIQSPKIWLKIQESLGLCNTGYKLTQQNPKYRLEELEKFLEKVKISNKAQDIANSTVNNLESLVGSVKDFLAQSKQLQELNLTEIGQILSDFLQNNITKTNFFEKIDGLLAYFNNINQRIEMLKSSCIELEGNYFDKINSHIGLLNEGLQNLKQGSFVLFAIEKDGISSIVACLLWILAANVILNLRKFPLKTYEKAFKLFQSIWNSTFNIRESRLYQTLTQEYQKGIAIKRELIFVLRSLKIAKELKENDPNAVKFSPLNSEYLMGLVKRTKRSRVCFAKNSKQIQIALEKAKEYEKAFDKMVERFKQKEKISEEEYREFLRKVNASGSWSRELAHKLQRLAKQSKELREHCSKLENTQKASSDWLAEMNTFDSLYAEYPISNKTCDEFLKTFKGRLAASQRTDNLRELVISKMVDSNIDGTDAAEHGEPKRNFANDNIEPAFVKKIKDNNGDQIIISQQLELNNEAHVPLLQQKLEKRIRSELGDDVLIQLESHLPSFVELLEEVQKENVSENIPEEDWTTRLINLIKNRSQTRELWRLLEATQFAKYSLALIKKAISLEESELFGFETRVQAHVERAKKYNGTAKTIVMNLLSGRTAKKSNF